MALIDVERLRAYLLDCCGTAAFGGFPAAMIDIAEIEDMDGEELCCKADELGVDLRRFVIVGEGGA